MVSQEIKIIFAFAESFLEVIKMKIIKVIQRHVPTGKTVRYILMVAVCGGVAAIELKLSFKIKKISLKITK